LALNPAPQLIGQHGRLVVSTRPAPNMMKRNWDHQIELSGRKLGLKAVVKQVCHVGREPERLLIFELPQGLTHHTIVTRGRASTIERGFLGGTGVADEIVVDRPGNGIAAQIAKGGLNAHCIRPAIPADIVEIFRRQLPAPDTTAGIKHIEQPFHGDAMLLGNEGIKMNLIRLNDGQINTLRPIFLPFDQY